MFYLAVPKLVGLASCFIKDEKLVKNLVLGGSIITLIGAIILGLYEQTLEIPYLFEEGMRFSSVNSLMVAPSLVLVFITYIIFKEHSRLDLIFLSFMEAVVLGLVYSSDLFTAYIMLMIMLFIASFLMREKGSLNFLGVAIFGSLVMLMGMFVVNHTAHGLAFENASTSALGLSLITVGVILPYFFPFHGSSLKASSVVLLLTALASATLLVKIDALAYSNYLFVCPLVLSVLALFSKDKALDYALLANLSLTLLARNEILIANTALTFGGIMMLDKSRGRASRLIYVFLSLSATGVVFAGLTGFGSLYLSLSNLLWLVVATNILVLASLVRVYLVEFNSNDEPRVGILLLNLVALLVITGLSVKEVAVASLLTVGLTFILGLALALLSKKVSFTFKFNLWDDLWLKLINLIWALLALVSRLLSDVLEGLVYLIRRFIFNSVNERIEIKGNRTFTVYDEDAKYGKIFHEDLGKSLLLISIGLVLGMLYMLL